MRVPSGPSGMRNASLATDCEHFLKAVPRDRKSGTREIWHNKNMPNYATAFKGPWPFFWVPLVALLDADFPWACPMCSTECLPEVSAPNQRPMGNSNRHSQLTLCHNCCTICSVVFENGCQICPHHISPFPILHVCPPLDCQYGVMSTWTVCDSPEQFCPFVLGIKGFWVFAGTLSMVYLKGIEVSGDGCRRP